MADWREEASSAPDWRAEAEGGAEGGGGSDRMPSKPLIRPSSKAPTGPQAAEAEEKRRMALAVSGMTGGQNLASLPEEQRDAFNTKSAEKALGQGIAFARGVPLTGAHIDELSALFQTGSTSGGAYDKKRDEARRAVNQAVAENPALPHVGSMAFAPLQPESAVGRVALSTMAGASEGAGAAPTMKDAPDMALKGGGIGLGVGLFGEALNQGGQWFGDKKAGVLEKNQAVTDKMLDKAFGSARGAYGGNVANGANLLQSAERAVSDERLPQSLRDAAADWLNTDEAMALREQVVRSNLGRGEDALSRIRSSQDAMREAASQLTPGARAAAAQARLDDSSALTRRLRELGPKVVFPVVGGAVAGPVGAGAGGLLGAVAGRSATTVRNAITDPYVASRLLGAGEATLGGAGKLMSAASPDISRSTLAPWSRFLEPEENK